MTAEVGRATRLLERIRGVPIERDLRSLRRRALSVVDWMSTFEEDASDEDLRRCYEALRDRVMSGSPLESEAVLTECFGIVAEAARRTLRLRIFEVQIAAAIALSDRRVVEMQTGEGKTLVAVLPACLAALEGLGVHILTFNDYLARRDAEWMGPVYRLLGLEVGVVQEELDAEARRAAYAADVTYSTAKQVGFDFLRSTLAWSINDIVLRPFHRAIVDEADSILIDEARIPMVIAGTTQEPARDPRFLADIARDLERSVHYEIDENDRNVQLAEAGSAHVERVLGCGSLHEPENLSILTQLNQALHAEVLLRRDVDYIVRDGCVEHVDELTGRVVADRQWPDGLQAALRAKEGLLPRPDSRVLNSITVQHLMQRYPMISGMTATACAAAEELAEVYGLSVVVVPPNVPCCRVDEGDLVFATVEAKHLALVEEIRRLHRSGRPILVGTASVRESELLAETLTAEAIDVEVLNAKTDDLEARIIAEAGALGAVTISTNMAGRGTDIKLGGADESQRDDVVELGGLLVIGTNRHESRRIDDQLRGRSGRQGDPGSSRFFISLEDELMTKYKVAQLLPSSFVPKGNGVIDDRAVGKAIARVQRIVEGQSFTVRHNLYRYSSMLEEQRRVFSELREALLTGEEPSMLEQHSPERWAALVDGIGLEKLRDVERTITLSILDLLWSDHLEALKDIQEGIHLVELSGRAPLIEFQRRAIDAFDDLLDRFEQMAQETFEGATITSEGIDLEAEGLFRPSSTWTYLVSDRFFDDGRNMLIGNFGVGSVAAVSMGPLLFLQGIVGRIANKLRPPVR